jgi:RNA polymerase sigma-70 factor (ECF subfamily)
MQMKRVQATKAALSDGNREVLPRAQGGDMSAFEALVERYRDQVYAFGLRTTDSETDALEIAQESFLSAYLHLDELRNEADFAAWVHWIAASHASLRLRLSRRARAFARPLETSGLEMSTAPAQRPKADWSNDLLEWALSPELRCAIKEVFDRLPQQHREIFLFKDMAGLSYEQVAHLCGESIQAVKSRLHQARLILRKAIDRFYNAEINRRAATRATALVTDS